MKAAGNGSFHLKTLAFLAEATLCFSYMLLQEFYTYKVKRNLSKVPPLEEKILFFVPRQRIYLSLKYSMERSAC